MSSRTFRCAYGCDGLHRLGIDARHIGEGRLKRDGQHLVHGVHEMEFHGIAQVLGNLRQVFLVILRQDDFEQAGAVRGEQLFFKSANGEDFAAKGDFSSHGQIAAYRDFAERAGNRGSDGDAGGGAVFRDSALRHVHVDIEIAVEITR